MARWGRTRAGAERPAADGGGELQSRHLLLVPSTVTAEEVGDLLACRVPTGSLAQDGEVRFGRDSRLWGPIELTMEQAVDAQVPMPWTVAYALDAPVEREDPPPPDLDDRDGFAHAFSDGLPWREEGRALRLLVGMARRLHGAVRVVGGGMLHPDPERAIDIVVHSPTWLDPEVVHGIVLRVLPDAELAVDGADWDGPDEQAYTGQRIAGDTDEDPLGADELETLHVAADEMDMQALSGEDTIDAYAIVGEVGQRGPDGRGLDGAIEVLVHVTEPGEPAVAGQEWADYPFVSYEVRWACPVPEERERRSPGAAYLAARERVRPVVHAVAAALVEASGGVVTDEDGFRLDRYAL